MLAREENHLLNSFSVVLFFCALFAYHQKCKGEIIPLLSQLKSASAMQTM